ncbi:unnamed protein product [Closterium sp. NIES-53]
MFIEFALRVGLGRLVDDALTSESTQRKMARVGLEAPRGPCSGSSSTTPTSSHDSFDDRAHQRPERRCPSTFRTSLCTVLTFPKPRRRVPWRRPRHFQLPVAASPATTRASSFDSTDRIAAAAAAAPVPFPQSQWPTAEFFARAGSAECAQEGQGEVCMEAVATSDMRGGEETFRAVPLAQSPFHFFIREDAAAMGEMVWEVASPVTTLKRADSFASSSSSASLDAFALPPADFASPSRSGDDSGCDLSLSLRLPAAF